MQPGNIFVLGMTKNNQSKQQVGTQLPIIEHEHQENGGTTPLWYTFYWS